MTRRRLPTRALAALPLVLLSVSWVFAAGFGLEAGDDEPWELAEPRPAVDLRPARLTELEGVACGPCHDSVVDEWAGTGHALSWCDEVYQEHIADRKKPALCHSCHIPEPLLAGDKLGRAKARDDALHLGITCDTCHLGPDGEQLGPRGLPNDAHATRRSDYLHGAGTNALCARCHSTNIGPVIGVAKDFTSSKQAERGRSCVGCHMAPIGPAGEDGHVVRSHALQTPRDPAFLAKAFAPRLEVTGGTTRVVIDNRAGHRVPGLIGREIRFTATVLDASGAVVASAQRVVDVEHYLPVDGSVDIEVAGTGAKVLLVGDHTDPREPEREVRFLESELHAEGR